MPDCNAPNRERKRFLALAARLRYLVSNPGRVLLVGAVVAYHLAWRHHGELATLRERIAALVLEVANP